MFTTFILGHGWASGLLLLVPLRCSSHLGKKGAKYPV
jgi:hypothetical protein